jgi:isoleucyl-tRNA synthetase
VQDLRKTADLQIADRIRIYYTASAKLADAVKLHAEYIAAETLAVEIRAEAPPPGAPSAADEFDGETLSIAVAKSTA